MRRARLFMFAVSNQTRPRDWLASRGFSWYHRRQLQGTVLNMSLEAAVGRLLCWLGLHDFETIESAMSFGCGGAVETVKCRRCGYITTRSGQR